MAQTLPFNMESIQEMADFIAGELQNSNSREAVIRALVNRSDVDRKLLTTVIESSIYNFEADLIGRYGEDQRFIDLEEKVDPKEDYDGYLEEPQFLEEGDEWRR